MGRRIRLRREEEDFLTGQVRTTTTSVRDDRREAEQVRNEDDLQRLTPTQQGRVTGAVGQEIKRRGLVRVSFGDNTQVRVDRAAVQQEAEAIRRETLGARFYPQSEIDREVDDIAREQGISRRRARTIRNRNAQIRAQAVLATARAGNVTIEPTTKGILNNYARGDYERAIYGRLDERGNRTYERGRYFTELGFDAAERRRQRGGSSNVVNTPAAREEARLRFLQNVRGVEFRGRAL